MPLQKPRPEYTPGSLGKGLRGIRVNGKPFIFATLSDLRAGFKAKNLLDSFMYAWEGLCYAAQTQRNFRLHLGISAFTLGLAALLHVGFMEWAILGGMIGMVLFAELTNTVVELVVDMMTEGRFDERAKVIKDMAAAAVLLTAITASCVGAVIFIPHLLKVFKF